MSDYSFSSCVVDCTHGYDCEFHMSRLCDIVTHSGSDDDKAVQIEVYLIVRHHIQKYADATLSLYEYYGDKLNRLLRYKPNLFAIAMETCSARESQWAYRNGAAFLSMEAELDDYQDKTTARAVALRRNMDIIVKWFRDFEDLGNNVHYATCGLCSRPKPCEFQQKFCVHSEPGDKLQSKKRCRSE